MTGTDLARRDQDAFALGRVFKESGMFPTVKKEAEAVVKILAGREFGLGPLASMQGIHMVDGKPTLAANLIAGQIKRHPRYNYKVIRREADGCELEFFEDGQSAGRMTFEKKDATAAGLLGKMNWKKYPRDMYFARCLTAGARTFCPDVLGGSPIYTAEELGADEIGAPDPVAVQAVAEVRDEPEVVDAEPVETANDDTVKRIRAAFDASGKSTDWLALKLVEITGQDVSSENPGPVIRSLTLEQAMELYRALTDGGDLVAESFGGES